MREIIRLVVVLALICAVSGGALTVARHTLAPRIEQQSDFYVRGPALERLFEKPAAELLGNKIILPVGDQTYPVFYLADGDEIIGLAIEAPGPGGYAGDIVVMIGIDLREKRMIGLEIIQHSETPGVGSKVEKSSFRKQWMGLPVDQSVELTAQGGQIDAISGATYSSKAVVSGSNQIIELMIRHGDEIMALIETKEK